VPGQNRILIANGQRRTRGAKGEHVEQKENTWNKRRTRGTKGEHVEQNFVAAMSL
jgi:hypothetical protein